MTKNEYVAKDKERKTYLKVMIKKRYLNLKITLYND
jgi:hypothetical protein